MKSAKREQYERAAELTAVLVDNLCKQGDKRLLFAPQIANGAVELLILADRLHRYAETACNYQLTPQQEKREKALADRVLAICGGWNVSVKFGGDPRGFVVKLMLPDGSYNTWGGKEEGWGI